MSVVLAGADDGAAAADLGDVGSLPELAQVGVLSFLDIPSLYRTMLASHFLATLARSDTVWEPHLKKLLRTLFDGAFKTRTQEDGTTLPLPLPISQRSDWKRSSKFLDWHHACMRDAKCYFSNVVGCTSWDYIDLRHLKANPEKYPEEKKWLWWYVADVDLIEFYRSSGRYAVEGVAMAEALFCDTNRCNDCFSKVWACACTSESLAKKAKVEGVSFRGLPKIKLFRGASFFATYPCETCSAN